MFISELKLLIEESGLSVAKFSKKVKVHPIQMGRYLKGENEPRADIIKRIRDVYPRFMKGNTSVSELQANGSDVSYLIDVRKFDVPELVRDLMRTKDEVIRAKDEVIRAKDEAQKVSMRFADQVQGIKSEEQKVSEYLRSIQDEIASLNKERSSSDKPKSIPQTRETVKR